ncbi:MAG: Uma2 family endonuclease [Caldilineaceae bacterium]
MSELTMLLNEEQEIDDMGSFNHSLVQGNLAYSIRSHSGFSAFIELSLDASSLDKALFPTIKDELIPDVCAYPKTPIIDLDILQMREMPLLVIEVISPRQGGHSIVQKFQAYFALGIHSCWLVDPTTAVVRVYSPNKPPITFASGDVIDDVVNLRIPLAEIFG